MKEFETLRINSFIRIKKIAERIQNAALGSGIFFCPPESLPRTIFIKLFLFMAVFKTDDLFVNGKSHCHIGIASCKMSSCDNHENGRNHEDDGQW